MIMDTFQAISAEENEVHETKFSCKYYSRGGGFRCWSDATSVLIVPYEGSTFACCKVDKV